MGLFELSQHPVRQAVDDEVVKALAPICNDLEVSLADTPTEYLVLQGAGMALALERRIAPEDVIAHLTAYPDSRPIGVLSALGIFFVLRV